MQNHISPSDFWQWAYSDFRTNALRGVLAEYIVATALGCISQNRLEWDAYDLRTNEGITIEVKCSAYLQAWNQGGLSKIRFDIAKKFPWNAKTNTYSKKACRVADVYVFCIFAETDADRADELDLNQWQFLVCTSNFLNKKVGAQKSISLSSLEALGLESIGYAKLKDYIDRLIAG